MHFRCFNTTKSNQNLHSESLINTIQHGSKLCLWVHGNSEPQW